MCFHHLASPHAHVNIHCLSRKHAESCDLRLSLHPHRVPFSSLVPFTDRIEALPSSLQLGPSVSLFLLSLAHEERQCLSVGPRCGNVGESGCASRAEATGPRGGDCGKILMPLTTPQRADGAQPAATGAGTRARARLPAFTLQVSFTGFAKNVSLGRREKIRRRPARRETLSVESSFLTVAAHARRDAKNRTNIFAILINNGNENT